MFHACKCFCCLSASGLCFLLPVTWSRSCDGRVEHPGPVSSVPWLCCRALPGASLPGALVKTPVCKGRGGMGHSHLLADQVPWVVVFQDGPACAQGATQALRRSGPFTAPPGRVSTVDSGPRLTKHRLVRESTPGAAHLPAAACSPLVEGSAGSWRRTQVSQGHTAARKGTEAEQGSMCPSFGSWPSPVLGVASGLKVAMQGLCAVFQG